MSALSEKIRVSLFAKLNVPSVTDLATGGVYHKQAPESASLPYVIFQRAASKDIEYSFGMQGGIEDDLWMIKALSDEDSSDSKEPEALNEEILAACLAAVGNSLTITGGAVLSAYRKSDIPDYTEQLSDRSIYHNGFLLRVVAE